MKKKVLSLILTGVLAASMLTGCGGSKDTKKEDTKTEAAADTKEKAEEKTEEAAETTEEAAQDSAAARTYSRTPRRLQKYASANSA